jgi:hypothetical protein
MEKKSTLLFFVITLICTGIFLWLQFYYSSLKHWNATAIFVMLLAFIFTLLSREINKTIISAVACGYMGAYIIEIIIDVISDSTSHNLWPFEIILLSLTTVLSALIGFGLGYLIKKVFTKTTNARNKM